MTEINTQKQRTARILVLIMMFHLVNGTGMFCAGKVPHLSRTGGNDHPAAVASLGNDVVGNLGENASSPKGKGKCSCKKKKACPTIPRTALTSHPAHLFNQVQRQIQSSCCNSLISAVMDHGLVSQGDPPFLEVVWFTPFCSSSPLAITCVLLI